MVTVSLDDLFNWKTYELAELAAAAGTTAVDVGRAGATGVTDVGKHILVFIAIGVSILFAQESQQ